MSERRQGKRHRKKSKSVEFSVEKFQRPSVRSTVSTDNKEALSTSEFNSWNPLDAKWDESSCSMVRPRRKFHSISQDQNYLYLYGGESKTLKYDDLYQLDIENQAWYLMEKTKIRPPPLSKHSSSVRCNNLYIFGGQNEENAFNSSMYCFNLG